LKPQYLNAPTNDFKFGTQITTHLQYLKPMSDVDA
jgi:hypothetical protein